MKIVHVFVFMVAFWALTLPSGRALASTASAVVASIDLDGTLVLVGGKKISLSGLRWWNQLADGGDGYFSPQELVEKYLDDKHITIEVEPKSEDRYGRLSAVVRNSQNQILQIKILSAGEAMFWPNTQKIDEFKKAENEARSNKRGRWAWSKAIIKCHNWQGFWSEGLAIIRGKIKAINSFGKVVYINFSEPWWKDFTIKTDEKWLQAQHIKPQALAGKMVEVRGWLYWQAGPQISMELVDQLVFIDPDEAKACGE